MTQPLAAAPHRFREPVPPAINLLGIATLAYEKGIPFDIDSEYLPIDLVDGSFLKM